MNARQIVRSSAVALAGAAVLAQSALAAGEPKNQWPFTRQVEARATQAATHVSSSSPILRGESKNQAPFTQPVATVVVQSGGGFSWTDGGIGLVAGIGVALSGGGALLLARNKSPRTA